MARFARFKAFAVRTGAKVEAGAVSLIPIEKRLSKALQAKKGLRAALETEKRLLSRFSADRKKSQNALVLSIAAERQANQRVRGSETPRELARAQSDLKAAEKLTRKNQNGIRLAGIAIGKREIKVANLSPRVEAAERNVISLEAQAKAVRARKSVQATKPKPRKTGKKRSTRKAPTSPKLERDLQRAELRAAKAELKFERSRRGFRTRSRKNKFR